MQLQSATLWNSWCDEFVQHSTMQLQFATLWNSWCDEFMQHSTVQLQFATLWTTGRRRLQHTLPCVLAVKCTNTLMTEEVPMLQHAAMTTAASDALSVDWWCISRNDWQS